MTLPTPSASLTRLAVTATAHCLTGCAIGEILGMVIGTALGWSTLAIIALAVALAFLFGYALTIGPVLRSGFTLAKAIPVALAADTVSITVMEIVDNAIMLVIPSAMGAGVANWVFWAGLALALAVAFVVTVPVNRALIARGKGHAVVHQYHHGDSAQEHQRDDHADLSRQHCTADEQHGARGGHREHRSPRPTVVEHPAGRPGQRETGQQERGE